MSFENTSLPYYSEFIHLSRYSRWLEDKQRRETWEETVTRLLNFWNDKYPFFMADTYKDTGRSIYEELYDAIYNLEVMPSMRSLWTAGPALDRDNVAGYNCSFAALQGRGAHLEIYNQQMEDLGFDEPIRIQLKNPITFDEIFYILLCGTGVGFSVERQFINNLPTVGKPLNKSIYRRNNKNFPGVDKEELSYVERRTNTIIVEDSKYGWASALRILIVELYNGNFDVKWDTSKIRPAGSVLKTFGGRSSGPGPLNDLFSYCVNLFKSAVGRKLSSIEVHGLVCKIADIVVVGGVRRSALISLSNLSDDRMRHAKSGDWWVSNPEFQLSNNSACYTEKPDAETFIREWSALIESKSGERGIFSRTASKRQVERIGRRDANRDFGTNPCSEIILRDQQFCNLSEVVCRNGDTFKDLERKVKLATILGTLQSTLTNFKYLNPEWKQNTEEERLLGVSLTGIMDHPMLSGDNDKDYENAHQRGIRNLEYEKLYGSLSLKDWLIDLKKVSIDTNKEVSQKIGINQSAAITCVKPSGTVSQLVDSASGIHPRHSKYYLRSVRNDIKDPLSQTMIEMGFPYEVNETNSNNYVFYFPIKSPDNAITKNDMTAIEQLELWKIYQTYWCEHKPSITVSVGDDEWLEVGAWVYKNFDAISGISFLPRFDHVYKQAPYQDLTEEEYNNWLKKMPKTVNWNLLHKYESHDMTIGASEKACTGGLCEV
jgi:ribonucleoside-diphosphate reductase alpha chain